MRHQRILASAAALLLSGMTACGDRQGQSDAPALTDDVAPVAAPGASTPYLAAASDGTIWMSWMEQGPDSVWMLRVARRAPGGAWTEPRTAVRDSLLFANWADFPSIAVGDDGRLVAHVLRRSAPGKYSYHVWVATSMDTGATWSAPQRLHSDTSATEHGFAALVPQDDGSTFAAWLDGHATAGGHEAHGESGAMNLGFAVIDPARRIQRDTMLDTRVCDCCQVAGARTASGAVFAYRDRSPGEVRDIAVVRYTAGRWHASTVVHEDGWVTKACPVNGPALSARDRAVVLAWFTNARDTAKVQLSFSRDDGATWSAPVRVDDGVPLGRVDVELLAGGGALATWMERTGTGAAEIRARHIAQDGMRSAATVVSATSDARQIGFPRITAVDGRSVYVAWRELPAPARLRLARLEMPRR
jgi:hypothetical protein